MKKIAIVGNGLAGIRACEEIRRLDGESEITVFCEEPQLPYQPQLFGDFLAKAISEENLLYRPADFYKTNKIRLVTDQKIQRIDFKKKKVTLEGKEQPTFDILLINTTARRLPDLKGANKRGVFGLHSLSDIKDILTVLHLVEVATIDAESVSGLQMAYGLRKRGKDVVLAFTSGNILSGVLEKENAVALEKCFEENGVRMMRENGISEILGEGDVKAVKLKSGKVIASQMVIVNDQKHDLRLFADSGLELGRGVLVDEHQRTNMENVFAVGSVSERRVIQNKIFYADDPAIFEEQGRVAGCVMCGEAAAFTYPGKGFSFNLFGMPVVLGENTAKETAPVVL